MPLKVAIIGAGVNGLSCGVKIVEHFQHRALVTVISEDFTPNTTGDGSAGLWGPYLLGTTKPENIMRWSKEVHDFCRDLWISEDGGEAGICLLPAIRVSTTPEGLETFWKDIVYGFRNLTAQELKELGKTHKKKYSSGAQFVTFTSEPAKLLPYLMKRFERSGGKYETRKVNDLQRFIRESDYDVFINCTGLGSKWIVPDNSVHPIRGQVMRVDAQWIKYSFLDESDDGVYIIPNCDTVILGGTHQVDDYNTNVDQKDSKFIREGCEVVIPAIKNVKVVKEWVGLRPGRDSVRLEKEVLSNGKILIHNYGHGGSGVTLAWGCATDVLNLLTSKSKL